MSSRFSFAPAWVEDQVDEVRREHFPSLVNARILVLFDEKQRMSLGAYVFGRMAKAKDVEKLLAEKAEGKAYDYVLYLDREVFLRIDITDQVRLIRHELRHCRFDIEDDDDPYKLTGHEIEDFHVEVELNADSPDWVQRLAVVAEAVYQADIKPPITDPRQQQLFSPETKSAAQKLVDTVGPGESMSITNGDGEGVHVERPAEGGPAKVTKIGTRGKAKKPEEQGS